MQQKKKVKKLSLREKLKMWWEIKIGVRYACCTYYKSSGHKHNCPKKRPPKVKPAQPVVQDEQS